MDCYFSPLELTIGIGTIGSPMELAILPFKHVLTNWAFLLPVGSLLLPEP